MELFREILKVNKKYNLIEINDIIVVGFSGGPDSVFLVEMLKKLKNFINFNIYLVHINHLLRGEDADSDENFSFEYAKKNNLEIFIKKINNINYGGENYGTKRRRNFKKNCET